MNTQAPQSTRTKTPWYSTSWGHALRWITLPIAFFLVPSLLTVVLLFAVENGFAPASQVFADIKEKGGFGGHYIMGPIYIIIRGVLFGSTSVGVVYWWAPNNKKHTAFIIAMLSWFCCGCAGIACVAVFFLSEDVTPENVIAITLSLVMFVIGSGSAYANFADDQLRHVEPSRYE